MKDLNLEEIKKLEGYLITAEELEELRNNSLVDSIELIGVIPQTIENKDYDLVRSSKLLFAIKSKSAIFSLATIKIEIVQVN